MGFLMGGLTWFWLLNEDNLVTWQLLVVFGVVDIVFGLSYGLLIPGYQTPPTSVFEATAQLVIGSLFAGIALGWVVHVADLPPKMVQPREGYNRFWTRNLGMTLVLGILFPMLPRIAGLNLWTELERAGLALLVMLGWWVGSKAGASLGRLTRILATSGSGVISEVRTLGAAGVFLPGSERH